MFLPGSLYGLVRRFTDFAGVRVWIALIASVVAVACEAAGFLLLAPLAALILGQSGGAPGPLLGATPRLGPAGLAALFAGLILVRALVLWVRDETLARLQVGFVEHLRAGLVGRIAGAPWTRLAGLDHARLVQILGGDLARCGAAAQFLVQGALAAILIVGQATLAFWLSPMLTLGVVAVVLSAGLLLAPLSRRARQAGQDLTDANIALAGETARFLGGLKLALSHRRQGDFKARTQAASERLAGTQLAFLRQQSRSRIATTTLAAASAGAALAMGHYILHLPAPLLVTLVAVFSRISGPALQLQQTAQSLMHALPAFEAVDVAAEALGPAAPLAPSAPRPAPRGDIRLRQVTFHHPGGGGVSGLTVDLAEGSLIGLQGPSGSGKTTTADLITGLLSPQSGDIQVGGEPLHGEALQAWQDALAYAPQDPFLLDDTVAANLRWARADASDEALWAALDLAGAGGLVLGLESGLDTRLGERGVRLSGGERQRLILARAILREADIMILDEALTALPAEAEREILAALRQARPQATILLISHRADVIADCDQVIRLDGGCLAADQIMKSGGGPDGTLSTLKT